MKYILGNWKSNKHLGQVASWFSQFEQALAGKKFQETEIAVFPPFPFLAETKKHLQALDFSLGVQDLSPLGAGSYTGAISSQNLTGLAVKYAIVGHSERRRYFHETHQEVASKVQQAVEAGITPVVCVDSDYIEAQAGALSRSHLEKCLVVYEPLSAIGTGKNAPLNQVEAAKKQVQQFFGSVPFLYGGSVTEENVNEYLLVTDGVLVGGASLNADHFARLLLAARGHQAAKP